MPGSAPESSFVTHLECSTTGEHYPAGELIGLSRTGKPLLVRYDLDRVAAVGRESLADRPEGMWRYRELLPVRDDIVSLGETATPLVPLLDVARSNERLHVLQAE